MRVIKSALLTVFLTLGMSVVAFAQSSGATRPGATVIRPNLAPLPGQVVITGTVPDEAARAQVLQRLRLLFGPGKVLDQVDVSSNVMVLDGWSQRISNSLNNKLIKEIHNGQIVIEGNQVRISGEVPSDASREAIINHAGLAFGPGYQITDALRVIKDVQKEINEILHNKTVEFRSGSAELTQRGTDLLDQLAESISKSSKKIKIIGHTDSTGKHASNIALSEDRAEAVKQYFLEKGLPAERFETIGFGPDKPLVPNTSEANKARNRRIEFQVIN